MLWSCSCHQAYFGLGSNELFALFGKSITSKVRELLVFNAWVILHPNGLKFLKYKWDCDGDSVYNKSSGEAVLQTYINLFDDIVALCLISLGRQGLTLAFVTFNAWGSISQIHGNFAKGAKRLECQLSRMQMTTHCFAA